MAHPEVAKQFDQEISTVEAVGVPKGIEDIRGMGSYWARAESLRWVSRMYGPVIAGVVAAAVWAPAPKPKTLVSPVTLKLEPQTLNPSP